MKWWQKILVEIFTNPKVLIFLGFLIFIAFAHFAGWHPERWISQTLAWLSQLNPSEIFN